MPPEESSPQTAPESPSPVTEAHAPATEPVTTLETPPAPTEAVPAPDSASPSSETSDEHSEATTGTQPTTQTAQIPANEPIEAQHEPLAPVSEPSRAPRASNNTNLARELLVKARATTQTRKQKKLEKIMQLLDRKAQNGSTSSPQVTNDEVEKLLHVSDATSTRYLSALEKEGKIIQVGKTGTGVVYSKI